MENDHFHKKGIHVEWTDFHGGTGAMTKALREGESDVCVLLTEGIIADIAKGNPSKIIAPYTNTPLIWGVHTGSTSAIKHYADIYDSTIAISRYGSGSHLMPIVDALQKGKDVTKLKFEVIKNLDGALSSLGKEETQVFYWEKYTTKPYVDKGLLRRLGEYVTPWPCFMIAATQNVIDQKPHLLRGLLDVIQFAGGQLMDSPDGVEMVANRYNLEPVDAEQWWHSTEWSSQSKVSPKMIESVSFTLAKAGVVDRSLSVEDVCHLL